MNIEFRLARIPCLLCFSLFVCLGGCQPEQKQRLVKSHGPHGGHTLAISQATDYSLEFTLDEAARKLIIYVFGNSSNTPMAIPVKQMNATFESGGRRFQSTFAADPRDSDPQGCSSRFSLNVNDLPQQLMNAGEFKINISYTVGEKTITALMQHKNNHQHNYSHD